MIPTCCFGCGIAIASSSLVHAIHFLCAGRVTALRWSSRHFFGFARFEVESLQLGTLCGVNRVTPRVFLVYSHATWPLAGIVYARWRTKTSAKIASSMDRKKSNGGDGNQKVGSFLFRGGGRFQRRRWIAVLVALAGILVAGAYHGRSRWLILRDGVSSDGDRTSVAPVAAKGPPEAVVASPSAGPTLQFARGFANFESPQSRPLVVSPDGERLLAVNTPNNSLAIFSLSDPSLPVLQAEIPVGSEPVSVAIESTDKVWVVNHVSDSISVVSLTRGAVIRTIHVGDRPSDIVFAGNPPKAYVSCMTDRTITS